MRLNTNGCCHGEAAERLQETLDEELEADKLLTSLAKTIHKEAFIRAEVVEEEYSITCSPFPQGGFMTTISTSKSSTFTNLVKSTATGFCLAILLVACQQPEKKVENAKDKVADARSERSQERGTGGVAGKLAEVQT
jgi:hypothetical protein